MPSRILYWRLWSMWTHLQRLKCSCHYYFPCHILSLTPGYRYVFSTTWWGQVWIAMCIHTSLISSSVLLVSTATFLYNNYVHVLGLIQDMPMAIHSLTGDCTFDDTFVSLMVGPGAQVLGQKEEWVWYRHAQRQLCGLANKDEAIKVSYQMRIARSTELLCREIDTACKLVEPYHVIRAGQLTCVKAIHQQAGRLMSFCTLRFLV